MTKFGNKGFMMAEVVVVAVIVAVTLVTLYTSTNRVTTAFNLRNRYYDLDCLNLAIAVNDTLIKEGTIERLINNTSSENLEFENKDQKLTDLYQDYNVENAKNVNNYFIKIDDGIDISDINDIKPTTEDYFDYLESNYDEENNYYIVSEICKAEDDCYYYGLGVK